MSDKSSLATRAFVAVGLMAGFYALAVILIVALLGVLYFEFVVLNRVNLGITLGCLIAAFAILRSVFFVSSPFEPPGPEISQADEPRLFEVIRSVAAEMGASMPKHVYVMADVNAFVAEVGGWMGIVGTRRVMAIGVGLLGVDSVSQLKATVAHEFGHYHGGDTKLGGFLYRTRGSLARALGNLNDDESLIMVIVSKPFEIYGDVFLDLTSGISRAQELAADEFSVRVAGKAAHVSGLRREVTCGALFSKFLNEEFGPVLGAGMRVGNLYEGYRTYIDNLEEDGFLEQVAEAIGKQKQDKYDTHPPLKERIAYAADLPDPGVVDDARPARALLANAEALEIKLTDRIVDNALGSAKASLKLTSWDDAVRTVVERRMEGASLALARALDEPVPGGVGSLFAVARQADRQAFARRVSPGTFRSGGASLSKLTNDVYMAVVASRIGAALVAERGYVWAPQPGRDYRMQSPSGELLDLELRIGGDFSEEHLAGILEELGIEGGSEPAAHDA
ncbi:MAG: M48 family metallopeptidase [Acidobacteria bacterium]|nr:M48 family metallopeptidase [Acidobacteriota bacterium]